MSALNSTVRQLHRKLFATSLRQARDGMRRPFVGALLTFVLLLAATLWMWRGTSAEVAQIAGDRFDFKVTEARFAIQQRLLAYEQVLWGGGAMFAANKRVTRDEWRTYVHQLHLDKNFPGIQAIAFNPRILPAELDGVLQSVRAEGLREYAIRPPGVRAEYIPVLYIEPNDWRNQRALGFDLITEPVRREAMLRARDSALPAVTGKIKLAQETNQGVQSGFLMCLPLFPGGDAPPTVAERRAAMYGQICGVFRMNDLMRGILGPEKLPNIRLQIFDGSAASADQLIYDSLEASSAAAQRAPTLGTQQAFEFDGRTWMLRFGALPAFEASVDVQRPRLVLVGGLLVSALFAAVVWSLSLNRRRARDLANANRGLQSEIVERTKLERQLEQAKDAAEAASQAKSGFLANVSHELRTPLTLILAPLEELLMAHAPSGWRTQLERAQRNALLLLNRVNDILDFSKAEAGKLEPRWEALDLADLIRVLAQDAAVVAESKGCALTWHVDPALGTVRVDVGHLEKIVLNFLSNAIKFTPAGGRIRVEATPRGNDCFELAVIDSGIGIPPDQLPLLFERFQQLDNSATRRHGGTGIGLALVKELAESMGGSVGVHSEPGRGSRFFVSLLRGADRPVIPGGEGGAAVDRASSVSGTMLRRVRFQEGNEVAPAPAAHDEQPVRQTSMPTVLVADDNPDMRLYVAELLREECNVITAGDGEQAWALLQRESLDVVVSDVMMPQLDGLGLTARIKARPALSHVPVILVTARGGSEASTSGLESGADDYIAKPFSPQELKARVRAALRMGRTHAQLRERSREAGMGMLATGLLHNLGNVLNGVTVSSGILRDKLRQSKLGGLHRVAKLLEAELERLPASPHQERRAALPTYVRRLADHLRREHAELLNEVETIQDCAEHAAAVIGSQQSLAMGKPVCEELVRVNSLMDSAMELGLSAFPLLGVSIERQYECDVCVMADRHRLLQILLNLLANASQALNEVPAGTRSIALRTSLSGGRVRLTVQDNGSGIEARHLPQLFNQGFTTKPHGHGSGLHSSANWAQELGGCLSGHSDGLGRGASFALELQTHHATAHEPSTALAVPADA
jgi:signal transduction histidine kinase